MLAAVGGADADALEAAVRIDNKSSERHGEDSHQKNDDAEATYQDCHAHFPLLLSCPVI